MLVAVHGHDIVLFEFREMALIAGDIHPFPGVFREITPIHVLLRRRDPLGEFRKGHPTLHVRNQADDGLSARIVEQHENLVQLEIGLDTFRVA